MKKTKITALFLSMAMVLSALAGCTSPTKEDGNSSSKAADSVSSTAKEKPVTISWYYPDQISDHDQKVFDEINKYTIEKINTKVEFHTFIWGPDYETKVSTMIAAGDPFDIMFNGIGYNASVTAGAALPVEDLLKTNAKETWDLLPEALWQAATINNHIYGIPVYKDTASLPCIIYNKTMADDLGITMPDSFGDMSDLEGFLYEVKAKKDAKYPEDKAIPLMTGLSGFNYTLDFIVDYTVATNVAGVECINNMGKGERVFNYYDTPDFVEDMLMTRKWVEDGILPLDLKNYDADRTLHNTGKIFADGSLGLTSLPKNAWSETYDVGLLRSTFATLTTESALKGVNFFGANSKNPEKAVEFMNLVNTDNFVATTIRFGIEGDYYKKTADNRLEFDGTLNADPANRAYYKWYGWQYGALFNMSLPATENPNLWNELLKANEDAHASENMGFVFDRTPVQTEIAACTAVVGEYAPNLSTGMIPNVEANIKEFREKMKAAGSDKMVTEAQKQLDAWRASTGKAVYKP